jgi:hypothetical protein
MICTAAGHQEKLRGELVLRASLGSGQGGAEVLAQLEAHQDVIKATLKTYLGYQRVCVKDISVSGRRLQAIDYGDEFTIKFSARRAVGHPAAVELRDALQDGFDAAGAGLSIGHASVAWVESDPRADDDEFMEILPIVLGGVLGACVLLGLGTVAARYARGARGRRAQASDALEVPNLDQEVVVKEGSNQAAAAEGKGADADWEVSSLSTGEPPASVEGHSSEASVPGSPADKRAAAEGGHATPI